MIFLSAVLQSTEAQKRPSTAQTASNIRVDLLATILDAYGLAFAKHDPMEALLRR